MNDLLTQKSDKIIIFIMHYMSTIRRTDCIMILEDGRITASGTHESLLEWDNVYARFYRAQVLCEV